MKGEMIIQYTFDAPCRCGFLGEGVHQCHAGRDPRYPGSRCKNAAIDKYVFCNSALAGMQTKFSVIAGHYCEDCWKEYDKLTK